MTEERFEIMVGGTAWDNLQDKELTYDENIDLLNEQHEQIERLKRNFKALDEVKCEIAEENEQLKKELEMFKPIIFESDGKPVTLYKKGDVE